MGWRLAFNPVEKRTYLELRPEGELFSIALELDEAGWHTG